MKKILLILCAMLTIGFVAQADIRFEDSHGCKCLIDKTDPVFGYKAAIWVEALSPGQATMLLTDNYLFLGGQKPAGRTTTWIVNKSGRIALFSIEYFDEDGDVINGYQVPKGKWEWQTAQKETMGEDIKSMALSNE